MVDPPAIDWPTTYAHTNTMEQRRAQFNRGELKLCGCRAGQQWRQYFTGVAATYEEPEVMMERQAQENAQRRQEQLFQNAGIPPKYLRFTLGTFQEMAGRDAGKIPALRSVQQYLVDGGLMVNDQPKTGIYLYGDPGVGKTGLLSPLFLHYLNEGRSGLWVQYNELMAALRDFESGNTEERIRQCQQIDYLFIDDFGDPGSTRAASSWAQDCMFRIVDFRNNHWLPMFITSNLDLGELSDQFHVRLSRRLADTCAVVKMGGRAL